VRHECLGATAGPSASLGMTVFGCAAVDAGMEFDCVGECLGATAGPSASLGMTVVEIVRLLKQGWSLIAG
jgi:hypothetical protein